MHKAKIYYQAIRGNKIDYKLEDGLVEWLSYYSSFSVFLTALGFEVEYTTNPKEGIVFIDLESCKITDPRFTKYFESIVNKYDKFILGTLNEPTIGDGSFEDTISFLDKYPNAIVITIAEFVTNKHDRLIGIPSFFVRVPSPLFNSTVVHPNSFQRNPKNKIYNHLSNNWVSDKFYSTFKLAESGLFSKGIISYKPPEKEFKDDDEAAEFLSWYFPKDCVTLEMARFLRTQKRIPLVHDTDFHVTRREWPGYVMRNSYFSLITESCSDKRDWRLVSEKTLYPILNKHPTLTIGTYKFNEYMASWGFEMYDMLFDYSFDDIEKSLSRKDALINQNVVNFNQSKYLRNINEIDKIATHNRDLLANPLSPLFVKLRKRVEELIERYYEL